MYVYIDNTNRLHHTVYTAPDQGNEYHSMWREIHPDLLDCRTKGPNYL